jgi:hypothetical protein
MSDLQSNKGKRINVKPLKADQPEKDWHWSYSLMLIGLFVGGGLSLLLASVTLITWTMLARIYLLIGLGLLIVPYRIYNNWLGMERLEIILGSLMGIAPLAMMLFLGFNMLFAGARVEKTYAIVGKEYKQNGWSPHDMQIALDKDAFADYQKVRIFDLRDYPEAQVARSITYIESKGAFGFDVVWETKFN